MKSYRDAAWKSMRITLNHFIVYHENRVVFSSTRNRVQYMRRYDHIYLNDKNGRMDCIWSWFVNNSGGLDEICGYVYHILQRA